MIAEVEGGAEGIGGTASVEGLALPHRRTKEELLQTVSASRLGTWLQCRMKFFFRYLSGIRKPPTPALHTGSVVHAVLQQWSLARWRKAPLEEAKILATFEHAWRTTNEGHAVEWDADEPEDEAKTVTFELIRKYLAETPIPGDERPEAVEVSVEKELRAEGLPTLVGRLDLVRRGGCIVDFKTTGKTPNPEMSLHTNSVQLAAYAMLYREATGRGESGFELHHLVKTKAPKVVITAAGPAEHGQIARLFRQIESYTHGLDAEDFVPSPGFGCAACEFLNECRTCH